MVKKLLTAAAVLALGASAFGTSAFADSSPMGQLPAFAQPGECFARVVIPAQTDIVPREVMTQEGYDKIEVTDAQFAPESQNILVKDGATRYVVRQPRWELRTEQVTVRPGFERLRVQPAQFDFVTETIQVGEPRLVWRPGRNLSGVQRVDPSTGQVYCLVEEPGQTITVQKRVLRQPERVTAEAVAPQTSTITRQVLVDPGGVEEVPVPPEYRTITTQRLVAPPQQTTRPVPAQMRSVDTKVVRAPERYEWVRVLCDTNATPAAVSQLQSTLAARGFYKGTVDGRLGPATSEALSAYQRANNMPHVGFVTLEALNSLGMNTGMPNSGTVVPAQSTGWTSSSQQLEGDQFTTQGGAYRSVSSTQTQVVQQAQVFEQPVMVQQPQTDTVREYSVRRELNWRGKQ
jgi:hypothetical protein